jgi:hypothetical protein
MLARQVFRRVIFTARLQQAASARVTPTFVRVALARYKSSWAGRQSHAELAPVTTANLPLYEMLIM